MLLRDVPDGSSILLDANILVYHFGGGPLAAACDAFLERVEARTLIASVSSVALAEMQHRLMAIEAVRRYGVASRSAVSWLRAHPGRAAELTEALDAVADVLAWPIELLPVDREEFEMARTLCTSFGLLTNDALVAATARAHGIGIIASNDRDFERVPDILLAMP